MKMITKVFLLAGFIIFSLNCTQPTSKTVSIVPFEILNYSDTLKLPNQINFYKGEHFLIRNYTEDLKTENYIDSFVAKNKDTGLSRYSNYSIVFYKESNKTNIENITKHPRDLDRYSQDHDLLFLYRWSYGKFESRYAFKKGQMIMPEDEIIMREIPDSLK